MRTEHLLSNIRHVKSLFVFLLKKYGAKFIVAAKTNYADDFLPFSWLPNMQWLCFWPLIGCLTLENMHFCPTSKCKCSAKMHQCNREGAIPILRKKCWTSYDPIKGLVTHKRTERCILHNGSRSLLPKGLLWN